MFSSSLKFHLIYNVLNILLLTAETGFGNIVTKNRSKFIGVESCFFSIFESQCAKVVLCNGLYRCVCPENVLFHEMIIAQRGVCQNVGGFILFHFDAHFSAYSFRNFYDTGAWFETTEHCVWLSSSIRLARHVLCNFACCIRPKFLSHLKTLF